MKHFPSAARRLRLHASSGVLALAGLLTGGQAYAQDAAEAVAVDDSAVPDTITVYGFRESLVKGIEAKREADQVIDVISAEEFGKFPDQNVAEAIQRVPGISMARDNGEGDKITIRGLEPDLTRVEINGRSTQVVGNVESPGMASSLAIFGSDQFSRIEVVKSPQAQDNEGGVGGIVRLLTARPLDIGEFAARAAIQGRYNDRSEKIDPAISGMVSNVFANGTIGVLVSGSYDDRTRRVDQTRNQNGWMPAIASQVRGESVAGLLGKTYSTHFDQQFRVGELPRINGDLTFQYKPTDDFELYINANAAHEDRQEWIGRVAINLKSQNPAFIEGSVNDSGTVDYLLVENASFTFQNRAFDRQTESYGLTVNPEWTVNDWTLSTRVDYSLADQLTHDRRIRHRSRRDAGYDLRGDVMSPVFVVPGLDVSDPASFPIDQNLNEYGKVETEELSYQFDVTRALGGVFNEVAFGAKGKNNELYKAEGPANGNTDYTFADGATAFPIDNFFKGEGGPDFLRVWPYVDAYGFVDQYGPSEADADAAINPNLTYGVSVDTAAAYVQTSFEIEPSWGFIRGNTGVRWVQDEVSGYGTREEVTNESSNFIPVEASNINSNILPSLNVVVEPNRVEGLQFRFAVGRVMTRPRFTQLNPTTSINDEELTMTRGNPYLKPFVANQYDAGVEYYFGDNGEGLLSMGLFHKDIENFVEPLNFVEAFMFPGDDEPEQILVTSYQNGGEGTVSGVELSAQTPFTFLPGPFDQFGGIFNYTYLDSSRTLATGDEVEIPGNSPHTANATLYYDNGTFSARVSYNYRDTYLEQQFGPRDNEIYVDADGRLDVSASYKFPTGAALTLDVANITGENRYEYANQADRVMLHQLDGRIVTLGLGYTF